MTKPWFLYLLECTGDRLYTGITVDVEARFRAHREGRGAKFTRAYRPVRILMTQRYETRSEASRAEYAVKRLTPEAKRNLARQNAYQGSSPCPDTEKKSRPTRKRASPTSKSG
jgi:putative endonuclease